MAYSAEAVASAAKAGRGRAVEIMEVVVGEGNELITQCPKCGAKDLYLQKDFPRKIALMIVGIGIITSFWTYGISLLVVALIDFLLFRRVKWMTVCYRCHTEYRGYRLNPSHKEFDRHLDELYRYGP